MKIRLLLGACALVTLTAACTSPPATEASAYGSKPASKSKPAAPSEQMPPGAEDMAKMMELWAQAGAPGEQHAAFAKDVGRWDLTVKSWMDPSAPPTESKSVAVRELTLDGRFMLEKVKGDMGPFGPFQGLGILGFNNTTQQYDHIWMDSMTTGMMTSHGKETGDGVVTMTGVYDDPMTKSKVKTRTVTRHTSADEQHFELYEDRGHGEMKSMEITYRRVKTP